MIGAGEALLVGFILTIALFISPILAFGVLLLYILSKIL